MTTEAADVTTGALTWPQGTPTGIRIQLVTLAVQGRLSGVPPQILSAICRYTSNWGLQGLGINGYGFGGYFGQHVGWSYPGRPQGFTAAELIDPGAFPTQAKVAAATLASYRYNLASSLAMYATGTPGQTGDGFVTYVLEATGADGAGPVQAPATPPPPSRKETDMISIVQWDTPGQHHLVIVTTTPDGKMITNRLHYWSASTKPGFDVEVLPPPPAA